MSGNSNIAFYCPSESTSEELEVEVVTEVDPSNILFIIHRRGFITCCCGDVVTNHICNLQTHFKKLKIKFELCSKDITCRFCENMVQWNYERYMSKEGDDKLYCRKCTKEIETGKGVCYDCFCATCYGHLDDCVCCNLCPSINQCTCDKDVDLVSDTEKNLS